MKKKSLLFVSALCIAGASFGYYYISTRFNAQEFYETLKNKEYEQASFLIQKKGGSLSQADVLILSAHIYALEGNILKAEECIHTLEHLPPTNNQATDLFLLRISLSILKNDPKETETLLATMCSLPQSLQPYYKNFLEGLVIKNQNPHDAIAKWEQKESPEKIQTPQKLLFDRAFPENFRKKLLIEAYIQTKNFDAAKTVIAKTHFSFLDFQPIFDLMLQMVTHPQVTKSVKEISEELFFSINKIIQNNPEWKTEAIQQKIINTLYSQGLAALSQKDERTLSITLSLLKKYNSSYAEDLFNKLKETFVSSRSPVENPALIKVLIENSSSSEQEALISFFMEESIKSFQNNNFSQALHYNKLIVTIAPKTSLKPLITHVHETILKNPHDSLLAERLLFYKSIASKKEFVFLAETILETTFTLWKDPLSRKNICILWNSLLQNTEGTYVQKKIELFLAEKESSQLDIDELLDLMSAEKTINKNTIEKRERERLNEHISKAKDLLYSGKCDAALKEICFILLFDNADAIKKLQGFAYYGLGDLSSALHAFDETQQKDEETKKLAAILTILLSPTETKKTFFSKLLTLTK